MTGCKPLKKWRAAQRQTPAFLPPHSLDMATAMSSPSKRKSDGSSRKHHKNKKVKIVDDSKSSSQQKRALKHERQSHRKHADAVTASKEIWSKLRLKNNTPDETKALMEELISLLKGKVNQIALQHDASRVVQAAIQFGTPQQRQEIVLELCQTGNLAELAKVQYAHFVVLKMIKYCYRDETCVRAIVKVRSFCFLQVCDTHLHCPP